MLFLLGNIGAGKAEVVKPSESFPGFFFLHFLSAGFRRNRGNKKVVGWCLHKLLGSCFSCPITLDPLVEGVVGGVLGGGGGAGEEGRAGGAGGAQPGGGGGMGSMLYFSIVPINVYMYKCVYVYVYMCICICISVYMYMCVYVYVCV